MQALFERLWRDAGQDTTEYVLAVLLVALALTAGILLFPTEINELFNKAGRVLISWI
jgi:Flp pilus assembly pilin Flp